MLFHTFPLRTFFAFASLVVPLAAAPQPVCSVPALTELPGSPVGTEPPGHAVVSIDANQDGFRDLAWVSLDSAPLAGDPVSLWVSLADGAGGYGPPVEKLALPPYSAYPVAGDVNNDGFEDVVIASYFEGAVAVALADGAGGYAYVDGGKATITPYPRLANLNGDSFPDLLTPSFLSLGAGDGTFVHTYIDDFPGSAEDMGVADFNSDGIDDLAYGDNFRLKLFLSSGGQGIASTVFLVPAAGAQLGLSGPAMGHFNNDAFPDLAAFSPGSLHVWLGDGAGGFQAFSYPFENREWDSPRAADLSGDGLMDFIVQDFNTKAWYVAVAQPDGSFLEFPTPLTAPGITRLVDLSDFDGDGFTDVMITPFAAMKAQVLRNTCPLLLTSIVAPNPGFSGEGVQYQFGIENVSDQATDALDWSLVAPPEVAILSATPSSGSCSTASNCTLGPLAPGQKTHVDVSAQLAAGFYGFTGPTATVSAAGMGPFDWRARHWAASRVVPEVELSVTPATVAAGQRTTASVSIVNIGADLARNATLKLTLPAQLEVAWTSLGGKCVGGAAGETVCQLGELTQTADSRVVEFELLANGPAPATLQVQADFTSDEGFAGGAQKSVEISAAMPVSTPAFIERPLPFDEGYGVGFPVLSGDVNRDGHVDLIAGPIPMFGAGDGTFTLKPLTKPLLHNPYNEHSRLADLNGDGFLDLISTQGTYRGDGSGFFEEKFGDYPFSPISQRGLIVGDFNEDGRVDLALGVDPFPCEVRLLLGVGDGTFTAGAVLPGCLNGSISGDFNNDKHLDFMTFDRSFDEAAVLHLGDGAGQFTAQPTSVVPGDYVDGAVAADFNMDGFLDLVQSRRVGSFASGLEPLWGDGAGGFVSGTSLEIPFGARPVAADWDLDGKPELIVPSASGFTVIGAIGDGLAVEGRHTTGGEIQPWAAADVNNDGRPDLIAGGGDAGLFVWLNTGPVGVSALIQPHSLEPGGEFFIEGYVQNNDPAATLTNVTLASSLPPGVEILSSDLGPGVICSSPGQCTVSSVPPGERLGFTLAARLLPETRGSLMTTLSVDADQLAAPLQTAATAEIIAYPAISIHQRLFPEPVRQGGEATLRITVANGGDLDAEDVHIDIYGVTLTAGGESLPAEILAATISQGTCTPASATDLGCDLGTIPHGGEAFVELLFRLDPAADGQIFVQTNRSPGGRAENRWRIAPAGGSCSFAITPTASAADWGASSTVDVDVTPDDCPWTPTTDSPWIIQLAGGTDLGGQGFVGDGSLNYGVSPFDEDGVRTGRIFIGDQVHTVTQIGSDACAVTIDPPASRAGSAGGDYSVNIPIPVNCSFQVADDATWIDVTSGPTLNWGDDQKVTFAVRPNLSGLPRRGSIFVNGAEHIVFQAGPPTKLGVFLNGQWFVDRNGDFAFDPTKEILGWGSAGDIPVEGDWNGDGYRDLGVFSGGIWFLDRNGDGAFDPTTEAQGWGMAGWTPVVGDWNGDGKSDLGVVEPATMTWFRDLNGDGVFDPATEITGWGSPGDTPVVGDWDGDGDDDLGVFSGGAWFRDLNGDGAFDPVTEIQGWGEAGWTPIVGDWNGDGQTDLGAIEPATMTWFRDLNGDGVFAPVSEYRGWGVAGAAPVVGDWDGDGDDDLGAFSDGVWFVDLNGDGVFDPATEFRGWGSLGWSAAAGAWK